MNICVDKPWNIKTKCSSSGISCPSTRTHKPSHLFRLLAIACRPHLTTHLTTQLTNSAKTSIGHRKYVCGIRVEAERGRERKPDVRSRKRNIAVAAILDLCHLSRHAHAFNLRETQAQRTLKSCTTEGRCAGCRHRSLTFLADLCLYCCRFGKYI